MNKKSWLSSSFLAGVGLFLVQLGGCSDAEEHPLDSQEEGAEKADAVDAVSDGAAATPDVTERGAALDELKQASAALDHVLDTNPDSPEAASQWQAYVQKNDAYANLIAEVQVAEGHVVKFYEPEPGLRLYAEFMPLEAHSALPEFADSKDPTFEEVHRALLPEAEVPEALLLADTRSLDGSFVSLHDPQEFPEIRPAVDLEKHAGDCSHFISHGSCPSASSGPCNNDFPWCICDIDVEDSFQVAGYGTTSDWFVAAVVGSVSIDLVVNGNALGIFAIPNGHHGHFTMTSPSGKGDLYCNCGTWQACATRTCHTWHFGEVLHVNSNEVYHFGGILRRSTC